jgi:hypothetical protein
MLKGSQSTFSASVYGQIVAEANNSVLLSTESSLAKSVVAIPTSSVTFSIYATNGVSGPATTYSVGDNITFEISVDLPTSLFYELSTSVTVPSQFNVQQLSQFNSSVQLSQPPQAGASYFGATTTLALVSCNFVTQLANLPIYQL